MPRRGQNFIQTFLASVKVTHLDIRTRGNALQRHFNVYATGSEVNNDEVWLYLCDLTISQAAFMQPSKAKERHYIFLLSPQRGSIQVPQPNYTQVERTEPFLSAQINVVGAEVPTDAAHAGVVTSRTLQPTTTRTT